MFRRLRWGWVSRPVSCHLPGTVTVTRQHSHEPRQIPSGEDLLWGGSRGHWSLAAPRGRSQDLPRAACHLWGRGGATWEVRPAGLTAVEAEQHRVLLGLLAVAMPLSGQGRSDSYRAPTWLPRGGAAPHGGLTGRKWGPARLRDLPKVAQPGSDAPSSPSAWPRAPPPSRRDPSPPRPHLRRLLPAGAEAHGLQRPGRPLREAPPPAGSQQGTTWPAVAATLSAQSLK